MGGDKERQVVAISTGEGGGVPGGRPGRKRASIDWSELPVVSLVGVGAKSRDGKTEGPGQEYEEGSDGRVRVVSEAEASFSDGEVGKEPGEGGKVVDGVSKVVQEEVSRAWWIARDRRECHAVREGGES
jgi:hypothetical protein